MKDSISIDLMLTDRCNFRCKYCYEKDCNYLQKSISFEVIEKTIQYINKLSKDYKITLMYWGGEPTIEHDLIIYITETLKSLNNIKFLLITNGYDINNLKSFLQYNKRKFTTQISYDYQPNQDLNRLTVSNKNTSERVKSNILWFAKNKIPFTIKSTIDLYNLKNLYDVYIDFIKFNKILSEYKYKNNLVLTFDTCKKYKIEEYEKIKSVFKSNLEKIILFQIENNIENNFSWFMPNRSLCNVGESMIAIDTDGSLYPCHGAIFSPNKNYHKLKYTIFDQPALSKITRKEIYKDKCSNCFASYCLKCNIHIFDKSNKINYYQRMTDYTNDLVYCNIMKEISKYNIVKNSLLK